MPAARAIIRSFTGGEVSQSLPSRDDLSKYSSSCVKMRNMISQIHGSARNRPGFMLIDSALGKSVLFPFQFNTDEEDMYVLVFSDEKIQIIQDMGFILPAGDIEGATQANPVVITSTGHPFEDGALIYIYDVEGMTELNSGGPYTVANKTADTYELAGVDGTLFGAYTTGGIAIQATRLEIDSPYTEDELYQIKIAQIGDIIYIVHVNHTPHRLVRTGHYTWYIEPVNFASSIDPPTTGLTAAPTGSSGSYTQNYIISSVNAKGEESVGSAVVAAASTNHPANWTSGGYITVAWDAVVGAEQYNVYKFYQGQYGLVGIVDTNSFRDDNYIPKTDINPSIANNPFVDGNNPGALAFHNQKLFFGGPNPNPNVFYGSNIGGFENFNKSQPVGADDSVEFPLAEELNQIKWLVSFGDLLVGTTGSELRAGSTDGKAIGPKNISVKAQSFWGSGDLQPLVIGNSVVHVERQRGSVRDLSYSNESQGYIGSNLSVLASHFFNGYKILNWAYQQTPDPCLWAVRDDGALLGMTYLREHEIWSWHLHETEGLFEAVAVIGGDKEDRLYASVNQNGTRYVLKLAPKWDYKDGIEEAFYVDFGLTYRGAPATNISGLPFATGQKVSILADGVPVEATVDSGAVTLDKAASIVHIGLKYTSVLAPLPFETELQDGTTQGQIRSFGKIKLRLLNSLGGAAAIGDVDANPEDLTYDVISYEQNLYDVAVPPFTGVKPVAPSGSGENSTVYVKQDQPLPLEVMAIIQEISFQ